LSTIVSEVNKKYKFDNIITSHNNFGKDFLPRIGGLLDIQPISDVCKFEGKNIFYRYIYAGNALSKLESSQKPNIMTIRLTSFDKSKEPASNPAVEKFTEDIQLDKVRSTKFVENMVSKSDKVDLSGAKVVISGGRALKSKENFKLLEELANCFELAAVGATRAAVDAGYVPNELQIGQTGKVVAPDLYVAIGISGAIQHIAGIKDSKVIVAINSDPDSPIFNVSCLVNFRFPLIAW
jgi:electron transfer flavoprotein alpha subunit